MPGILAIGPQGLIDLDFDVELTGFSLAEIDFMLDDARRCSTMLAKPRPTRATNPKPSMQRGDQWRLGNHRFLCGEAQLTAHFTRLVGNEQVALVFTDPPYNVKIDGNVCGLGAVKHREFAFASGVIRSGAIAFVCMDWRHMGEMLAAGSACFTELKNLVVWKKTNGGMGAFFRSKHELIIGWGCRGFGMMPRIMRRPRYLETQIEAFVEHYNNQRYHEALCNVTPAGAYFGKAPAIIKQRDRIKRQTIEYRRLQHRKRAAKHQHPDEARTPLIHAAICAKCAGDG